MFTGQAILRGILWGTYCTKPNSLVTCIFFKLVFDNVGFPKVDPQEAPEWSRWGRCRHAGGMFPACFAPTGQRLRQGRP